MLSVTRHLRKEAGGGTEHGSLCSSFLRGSTCQGAGEPRPGYTKFQFHFLLLVVKKITVKWAELPLTPFGYHEIQVLQIKG